MLEERQVDRSLALHQSRLTAEEQGLRADRTLRLRQNQGPRQSRLIAEEQGPQADRSLVPLRSQEMHQNRRRADLDAAWHPELEKRW